MLCLFRDVRQMSLIIDGIAASYRPSVPCTLMTQRKQLLGAFFPNGFYPMIGARSKVL